MAEAAVIALETAVGRLALTNYSNFLSDVPNFEGKPTDCIDDWINSFDTFRIAANIPDDTAANLLLLKMKADARDFVMGLDNDTRADLTLLRTAILNHHHEPIHINAARCQLRAEKWRPDDTPSTLYSRLKPLITKIHAAAQRDSELQNAIRERIPNDLHIMSTCNNFDSAAQLRDHLTNLQNALKSRKIENENAGNEISAVLKFKESQTQSTTLEDTITRLSNQVASLTQQKELNPQPSRYDDTRYTNRYKRDTICFRCGKKNHIAKNCRTRIDNNSDRYRDSSRDRNYQNRYRDSSRDRNYKNLYRDYSRERNRESSRDRYRNRSRDRYRDSSRERGRYSRDSSKNRNRPHSRDNYGRSPTPNREYDGQRSESPPRVHFDIPYKRVSTINFNSDVRHEDHNCRLRRASHYGLPGPSVATTSGDLSGGGSKPHGVPAAKPTTPATATAAKSANPAKAAKSANPATAAKSATPATATAATAAKPATSAIPATSTTTNPATATDTTIQSRRAKERTNNRLYQYGAVTHSVERAKSCTTSEHPCNTLVGQPTSTRVTGRRSRSDISYTTSPPSVQPWMQESRSPTLAVTTSQTI